MQYARPPLASVCHLVCFKLSPRRDFRILPSGGGQCRPVLVPPRRRDAGAGGDSQTDLLDSEHSLASCASGMAAHTSDKCCFMLL